MTACGTSTYTNIASQKKSQASPNSVSTPDLASNTNNSALNAGNITEDRGSLRIQSKYGFQCPYGDPVPIGHLVLASDRTTYSQDEIQQMSDYVSTNFTAAKLLESGTKPPLTLRWISVGTTEQIPGTLFWDKNSFCGATLNLINTGNTPIQIPKVGVQLQEQPRQNSYQYRLIEACSLIPPSQKYTDGACNPRIGNLGTCDTYMAPIQLGSGEKNAVFSGVPSGSPRCKTLTIAPATQVKLVFQFTLAPNTPNNLIYSIFPTLTVNTAQGKQTLSLPQLSSTFTFASVNQFSCYQLHKTTFVLLQPPIKYPQWCM